MTPAPQATDRRRHSRISLKGTAILLAGEHAVRGRISNLAEGGFLATTLVTAPIQLLGRIVDIELRLDDPQAKWIRVEGKIVRIDGEQIAIEFNQPKPALVRLVEAMVVASQARRRVLSIVLIDGDIERREIIAEGFRKVGCNVIEAQTPLEAIVRLGESAFEPDLIAIGDSVPTASAMEVREFVARNHTHVKLISITNDLVEPPGAPGGPTGVNGWLSSSASTDDLAERIRSLLARPHP